MIPNVASGHTKGLSSYQQHLNRSCAKQKIYLNKLNHKCGPYLPSSAWFQSLLVLESGPKILGGTYQNKLKKKNCGGHQRYNY